MKSKSNFHAYCICGNQQCISVQTQLCELLAPKATGSDKSGTTGDEWGQPMPIKIEFDPSKANYKAWLLVLSLCHHIPGFKEKFISTTFSNDAQQLLPTTTKRWFVNRIHFPRALLKNRSTYKIIRNQSLIPPLVAQRIAGKDGYQRLIEDVIKVSALENFARKILPPTALEQFYQQSQKQERFQDYYVQAPVGTLYEAKLHVSSLLSSGKLALIRKPLEVHTASSTK